MDDNETKKSGEELADEALDKVAGGLCKIHFLYLRGLLKIQLRPGMDMAQTLMAG